MKYITVKLTEDQAYGIIRALELDCNWDFPKTDKYNAFNMRIIGKLNKELAQRQD